MTALLILVAAGWGSLALSYGGELAEALRALMAAGFGLAGTAAAVAMLLDRWRGRPTAVFAVLLAAVAAWWTTLEPSNDRAWQPEVALLSHADIDGERVTVHNIRDFDYRTETDFDTRYYDKTFDLDKLSSIDLVTAYWAGPHIAHVIISFGFEGGDYLAVSIEARKERDEAYSSIAGFFRRYELYYVVADERDVIRLRTNFRRDPPEDVYLYRLQGRMDNARRLFLQYMRKLNELKEQPEFYNSLTSNCTNNIWVHTAGNPDRLPYSWQILLSGHLAEYLYEQGRFDTSLPFDELRRRSRINDRARAAGNAADFSRRIRAGS